MRCSAGMSSASASSGVSGVSETISSTSWPSGSWKTSDCGEVGIQPQQLAVRLVGDQAVHPVLERVVGRDAQDHAVDVAVAGDAGRRLVELEEGDDAARVALLVAEVGVVAERRLEVQRVLDEPEPHDPAPEVHVGVTSRVTPVKWCGPLSGCFMRSPPRRSAPRKFAQSKFDVNTAARMTLTAPRTIAGQVAERLKAEILAGERAAGTPAAPGRDRRSASASARRRCARRWRRCSAKGSCGCTRSAAPSSSCRASTTCATTTRSAPRWSRWPPPRPRSASSPRGRAPLEALLDEMREAPPGGALHRAQPALPHRRSTSTRAAPQLVAMIAGLRDASSAYLHIYRAADGLPGRPASTPSTARSSPRAWRAIPQRAAAATREHLENTVEHVASEL